MCPLCVGTWNTHDRLLLIDHRFLSIRVNWVVSANTILTHLKLDSINSGIIKILCIIPEQSCREPEVEVTCCKSNSSKFAYYEVIR